MSYNEEEYHDELNPSHAEVLSAQRISIHDIMDHITGPVVSVICHVILAAILATIVICKPIEERGEIEVDVTELEVKELKEIPPPPTPPDERKFEIEMKIDRPDTNNNVEVEVDDVPVEETVMDVTMPNLLSVKPNSAAVTLPGLFVMRTGAGRRKALKAYGNGVRTEVHVERALNWLAEHQNEDGSWGEARESVKAAITSLALLSFLAHGETPSSAQYGNTVLKAIRKLIEYVDACKAPMGVGSRGYEHGMVSYALAEAAALTRIPMAQQSMEKAMKILIDGMNKNGSFNYGYNNGVGKIDPKTGKVTGGGRINEPRSDLSVAGWQYQAIKAAFAGGSDLEGLAEAMDKAVNVGLKKTHLSPSGGFSYSGFSDGGVAPKQTMSAVGTLCLQLMGAGASKECRNGLNWMTSNDNIMTCDWRQKRSWALYAWYYQTQAIFQGYEGKGKVWRHWNKEFSKSLMREQERDGHWTTPEEKYHIRKGDKAGHGENSHTFTTKLNLHVYATSLCSLMLQVYYRYLPTFKVVKPVVAAIDASKEGVGETVDDLGLKIE